MINRAFEQEEEEKLFQRWIPYQGQYGFEEFKQMLRTANKRSKSNDEIMADVNAILTAQARASGAFKE